jgi:outer membrane protein TolC
MKGIIKLSLFGLLLISNNGFAQEKPLVLTLMDAVFLSIRNNPQIQSNQAERVSQKYELVVAKHEFVPQFELKSDFDYSKTSNGESDITKEINPFASISLKTILGTEFALESDSNFSHGNYPVSGLKFSVIQPLLKGFGRQVVTANLRNAYDQQHIYKLQLKNTIINAISTVIKDYMALVDAKQTLKIDQVALKNYQQTLSNDKTLVHSGRMARTETMQPEAQVAQQESVIRNDINAIRSARLTLLRDLGLDSQTNIIIPDKINFAKIINKLKGGQTLPLISASKKLALQNNSDYLAEGITIKTLGRNLIKAKDERRWQLDLTASRDKGIGAEDKSTNDTVGLSLNIPINDVDAKQGVINAQRDIKTAKIGYADQKRGLENDVEDSFNSLNTSKEQLFFSRKEFALRQQYKDISEIKYKAGRITTFELLQNQEDLVQAEQDIITNQINYINNLVDFDSKIGVTLERFNIKLRD